MDVLRLGLDEAIEGIATGRIVDAKTIIALLAAARRG